MLQNIVEILTSHKTMTKIVLSLGVVFDIFPLEVGAATAAIMDQT